MKSIILSVALIVGIVQTRAAMPGIDALVGSGHAIEICNADLNKQAAMTSSAGITLVKTSATQLSIQGFYNGNFNVTMDYMMGKGAIAEGPYKALDVKPDGRLCRQIFASKTRPGHQHRYRCGVLRHTGHFGVASGTRSPDDPQHRVRSKCLRRLRLHPEGHKSGGGTCLADYLHNRLREARSAPVSASPTYPTTTPSRY